MKKKIMCFFVVCIAVFPSCNISEKVNVFSDTETPIAISEESITTDNITSEYENEASKVPKVLETNIETTTNVKSNKEISEESIGSEYSIKTYTNDINENVVLNELKNTDNVIKLYRDKMLEEYDDSPQSIADVLVERSIVCYYATKYVTSAVIEYSEYDGDIRKIVEHKLFDSYSDFNNLVYATYNEKIAASVLENSPYLSAENDFLYDISKCGIVTVDIFSEGYFNKIIDFDDNTITFLCYFKTASIDGGKLETTSVKCEIKKNSVGEWRLNKANW